jgi:excinuclease ABC subunit C
MPVRDLKTRIARLPEQPGVYLFLRGDGETIYVGKARSLRDRVRSYLGAHGTSPKTDALLEEADGLDSIVTDSVVEALALENNLIKQRRPRYNILLRDDKNYPYLQLTTSEAFPRVLVARHVERDGNFYAGPFMPASLARRTMSLTHRLFGMRSCNEEITGRRGRPCLEYDIKRCIAPCVDTLCSKERYAQAVADTRLFLEGRNDELIAELRRRMVEAAAAERFEEAAPIRDAMRTVETLRDRQQKMATVEFGDRDAFGVRTGPAGAAIQVFQVRRGRVIERVDLSSDAAEASGDEAEVLQAALQQFYEGREVPPEIHVPVELADAEILESWLSGKAGRRVRLVVPKRGEKRGLLDLAARNAAIAYQARFNPDASAHYEALEALREVLGLGALPRRIEGFDISTIQGSETVASMVVCEDGRMRRGEYRKYRLEVRGSRFQPEGPSLKRDQRRGQWTVDGGQGGAGSGQLAAGSAEVAPRTGQAEARSPEPGARFGPDDFAAMNEVVLRRYRRVMQQGGPFPDLILIDGGKGQLSAAYAALDQLGLANLVAVGLAKKEELIFARGRSDPIALPSSAPALRLLQQIRDEAHRFAVTFHRKARARRDLRSGLDEVPGVGPRRRKALLETFGSLPGVRRASREELTAVVGRKVASALLAYFTQNP